MCLVVISATETLGVEEGKLIIDCLHFSIHDLPFAVKPEDQSKVGVYLAHAQLACTYCSQTAAKPWDLRADEEL